MASATSPPAASELDSYGASRGAGVKSSGDTEKATWFVASGAAHHATGTLSFLTEMASVRDQVVRVGSVKGKQVRGIKISGDTEKATWIVESFAANHMTGDLSLLSNMVPVSNQFVGAGNGMGMQVCGIGSVITETVVLHDVWYVPGLGTNEVSVDQVTTDDPDLVIMMAGTMCSVMKISDGSGVGSAHLRPDKKYEVDFLRIQKN